MLIFEEATDDFTALFFQQGMQLEQNGLFKNNNLSQEIRIPPIIHILL